MPADVDSASTNPGGSCEQQCCQLSSGEHKLEEHRTLKAGQDSCKDAVCNLGCLSHIQAQNLLGTAQNPPTGKAFSATWPCAVKQTYEETITAASQADQDFWRPPAWIKVA